MKNSRYGEVARVYRDKNAFILVAASNPFALGDAVSFGIFRTDKTSRHRGFKDKDMRQYCLGDGDFATIRQLIKLVQEYLARWRPPYIALRAWEDDDWVKRMTFYLKVFSRMGYDAIGHFDRTIHPGVVLLVPHVEGQNAFVKALYDCEKDDFCFVDKNGALSYIEW